ncbi:MAG: hypothetical protein IJB94_00175, partial [Clostridia bacterium]|nr:hypothetical protein [Clostridia bacterium]
MEKDLTGNGKNDKIKGQVQKENTYPYYKIIIPQIGRKVKMNVELFTKDSHFSAGRHEVEAVSAGQAIEFLRAANAETGVHGLVLREEEIAAVAEARRDALLSAGRVDFSGELPAKLACAFCDSPDVSQSEWAELLCGLIALFYDSKNTYDAT